MAIQSWQKLRSRYRRLLTIFLFLALGLTATAIGVLTPMSYQEAVDRSSDLNQTRQNIQEMDLLSGAATIFSNNFLICLIMFIPFFGLAIGFYILYNTGLYISAESSLSNVSPILTFLTLIIFPFAWLEFITYSTAFAENVWLPWRLIKYRDLSELVKAGMLILIVAGILFLAAIIEMAVILSFSAS